MEKAALAAFFILGYDFPILTVALGD